MTILIRRLALMVLLLAFAGQGVLSVSAKDSSVDVNVGSTVVTITTTNTTTKCGSGRNVFVALHENERTSVAAAKKVLCKYGGKLVVVSHNGRRYVSFTLDGKKYTFDPNRIFTDVGIKKTLGAGASEKAVQAVRAFRDQLIRSIRGGRVIALHNNTSGSYSMAWYRKGGQFQREAAMYTDKTAHNNDNFFFVTSAGDYSRLKAKGFNVALQSGNATNDGSLSVYAARSGMTYVNVEAQNGALDTQVKMLHALLSR